MTTTAEYLKRSGYASVDAWAEDSGFRWVDGDWQDEDGNVTDPFTYLATLVAEGVAK